MTILRRFLAALSGTGLVVGLAANGVSQDAQPAAGATAERPPLTNGFEVRLDAVATNEEIFRQPNLWVMEVTFKSMRMRWVRLKDPKTGKTKRELIWYLVYKAVNRPLDRRTPKVDTKPRNIEDTPPRLLFVPELTLVGTDGGARKIYPDVIIPAAQADILKRESRYAHQPVLKNTVEITGEIPAATPENAAKENAVYGVAMWRGVDPETDFFTVYMSGFSNGYRKQGGLVYRKVIVQKFQRPGDRFFQTEAEIKRDGDAKWIEWPSDTPAKTAPPLPAKR
ncbi:MAG: hypothetical protein ACE5KM_05955 [Planctomycetaceae bacterium]